MEWPGSVNAFNTYKNKAIIPLTLDFTADPYCSWTISDLLYDRGVQTMARGENATDEAISSGPRSHFVNDEKIIH